MDYCYTGCMLGRASRIKETLPDFFVEIRIPINGHNHVVLGNPKSTGISQVDGWSTGPPG